MKITFPRQKREIIGDGYGALYVVIASFNNDEWGFADFWDVPYTAPTYRAAVQYKRIIVAKAKGYHWKAKSFAVMKITF